MIDILLLGAGKIGCVICDLLAGSGDYRVTVADFDSANLERLPQHPAILPLQINVTDKTALSTALKDKYAVLSACPFHVTRDIARAAATCGVHYLDLTEDVETTRFVKSLANDSTSALIPQCGLAPGFISIATYALTEQFDELKNVHMRVGALPKYPSNALKYNLTWSTDGLINEYCNPCEAIVEGVLTEVPPLEEVELFSLDGVNYEAFNTSGGLGTLCETLDGRVNNLNYRTVRYPGHRDIMKMLLQDLRLRDRRDLLKDILENALPATFQDVVLVFVNVNGMENGQLVQKSYANKIYSRTLNHNHYSAIQITTAAAICTALDLLAAGNLPQSGFIRQEDIPFNTFMANRFGQYYAKPEATGASNHAA